MVGRGTRERRPRERYSRRNRRRANPCSAAPGGAARDAGTFPSSKEVVASRDTAFYSGSSQPTESDGVEDTFPPTEAEMAKVDREGFLLDVRLPPEHPGRLVPPVQMRPPLEQK